MSNPGREFKTGVTIKVCKGKHAGKVGVITRKCNHAWFELAMADGSNMALHSSYVAVASEGEIQTAISNGRM